MELTKEQFEAVSGCLPKQRGNVKIENLQVLNAILYVAEQGCKWRGLPDRFGKWHSVYMRMNRWSKNGVIAAVFEKLQREQIVRIKVEAVSLDSTIIKVHPDGTGALKKRAASHRQVPCRMEHQDSSGGRKCYLRVEFFIVSGAGGRRPGGTRTLARLEETSLRQSPHHGSGV